MKKIALVLALVLSMSCLAACGNHAGETTVPTTPLSPLLLVPPLS